MLELVVFGFVSVLWLIDLAKTILGRPIDRWSAGIAFFISMVISARLALGSV